MVLLVAPSREKTSDFVAAVRSTLCFQGGMDLGPPVRHRHEGGGKKREPSAFSWTLIYPYESTLSPS